MRRLRWNPSITAIAAVVCAWLGMPATASGDTITLSWDPSPDSSVIGYVLYVNGPSGYSQSFDVGRSFGYSFTEAISGQQYCFSVASYAAGPTVGVSSSEVCGYSNMAPDFPAISDRSTVIGQPVTLQLSAYDPDEGPVTYTAAGLPPGLSLQSSTGFISGTPTTLGTYYVTVTAQDDVLSSVRTFTWSIVATGTEIQSSSGTQTVNYSTSPGSLGLTSITADRSAPQPVGTAITFTATVNGGTAPQQYKWWVHDDSGWRVTRDWAQTNTWTWIPTVANSEYRIAVWVRNATTTVDTYENNQSSGIIEFPIGGTSQAPAPQTPSTTPSSGPLTLTSISADRSAPQPAGSSITFTATASGGASPYQYKWWLNAGNGWYVARDWAQGNTWTWTPWVVNSEYRVAVWVRNAGSSDDVYDNAGANGSIAYPISGSSTTSSTSSSTSSTTTSGGVLTVTSIGTDRVAPQPAGTSVTFTAFATRGTAPYQFKWFLFDGVNWTQRSDWSTSNTWTWTPTIANSAYLVGVWVRNAGTTADAAEAIGTMPFAITSGSTSASTSTTSPSSSGPLKVTGITSSRGAPSPVGVAVQFTAQVSGGTAPQQYKWWVFDGATWYAMTGWSTNNTWTWAPPSANSFQIGVWVRNAGSTADAAASSEAVGAIAFPVY